MVEELHRDLKKTYDSVKLVIAAKGLAIEMEQGEEYDCEYDIPLLKVSYRDLAEGEDNNLVFPLIQVRVRKDKGCEEELVVVMSTNGATKVVNNIDEDLKSAAEIVEKATEDFLTLSPDVVYSYTFTDLTIPE